MTLQSKFDIQSIVHLITDAERKKRIITAICFKTSGIEYELKFGNECSWHYEFEIENMPERKEIKGFAFVDTSNNVTLNRQ